MRKFILIILICISALLPAFQTYGASASSTTPAYETADVNIIINGVLINPERSLIFINQRVLAPARTTFKNLDAIIDWYPEEERFSIHTDSVDIEMKIGKNTALVNNIEKSLDVPPVLVKGTVMAPVRFVAENLNSDIRWDGEKNTVYIGKSREGSISRGNDRKYTVVIDPGHGGIETGAVHGGMYEKDLNLDMARRLNRLLTDNGVKTYMTRNTDDYLDLYSRAYFANDFGADLFISIHNNAGGLYDKGTMSLYYPCSNGGFSGKDFASIAQDELTAKLGTADLGIIPRPNLVVVRETKMPAVIAEVGYMTNKPELDRLKTANFRQNAAEALKNAILKALRKIP